MENEAWSEVLGFEGIYEASSFGLIRSVPRVVGFRSIKGTLLKQFKNHNGYLVVNLSRLGLRRQVKVHRAVYEAFEGSVQKGNHICHNDGDKTNNNLSNLRICSPKENGCDRVRHGTSPKGESNGRSKLKNRDVLKIRSSNNSVADIAKKFGVSKNTIYLIKSGKAWSHV